DRGTRAEGDPRAERLHDDPAPLHEPAVQMEELEEAGKSVAERLAGKEPVEQQEREPAGDERERDSRSSEPGELVAEQPRRARDERRDVTEAFRPSSMTTGRRAGNRPRAQRANVAWRVAARTSCRRSFAVPVSSFRPSARRARA